MVDQSHLDILAQGVGAWNLWRERNPSIKPDFSGADLSGADLSGADLSRAYIPKADLTEAYLHDANLTEAYLFRADLSGAHLARAHLASAHLTEVNLARANLYAAHLTEAQLSRANLFRADLTEACLTEANLFRTDLTEANLTEANLSDAVLERSTLVETNLEATTLTGCWVYGASAWDVKLGGAEQQDLKVSPKGEPIITVDDLEVAQFVYLLIDNRKLRNVIQTLTSKAVLILGNFSDERKKILNAIKKRLRDRDFLPILFDFEGPQSQRFIDTVTTVARLSRFVIADLTQPRSVTAELGAIVDSLPMLPIQLLTLASEEPPYAFIQDLVVSDSVLELHRYASSRDLFTSFDEVILTPALKKRDELEVKRLRTIEKKLGARQ